ncbi:MAG: hypothetical protein AAFO75_10890 [Pseudomonadota bacterium]
MRVALIAGSVLAVVLIAMSGTVTLAGLQQKWVITEGLANPESVLPDADGTVLYVSNVNGAPTEKNGQGFISKVSADGQIVNLKWVTALNAPKGLAQFDGKLYVADIDELVEIDVSEGKVLNRYPAKNAKFLNDVAVASNGDVYVSDMVADTIWRLADGKFEVWLNDAGLKNPNGLLIEGNQLRVAAWGVMTDGFATEVPGYLLTVDLETKAISGMGGSKPFGNLDGLEPVGDGRYLVTDWMAGKVMRVGADGQVETLQDLGQGAADIGYTASTKMLYVPQMVKNALHAYSID